MSLAEELYELYVSRLDELLKSHRGEFALVAEADIQNIHKTREDAVNEGLASYGAGQFLVQEILPEDEVRIEFHSRVAIPAK